MSENTNSARPLMSVGLVSVRQEFGADPAGTLKRLKTIGFEAVEPMRRTGATPEARAHIQRVAGDTFGLDFADVPIQDLTDALAEADLSVSSCLVTMPEGDLVEAILDEQEQLGNTKLVLPSIYNPRRDDIPVEEFNTLDTIKRIADRVNAAAERTRARGMRLGYHNHSWDVMTDFDGKSGLEVFFDLVDDDVFAEVDLYWALVGGCDPVRLLESLGSRVESVHLKDGPRSGTMPNVAVGSGEVDTDAILERIRHLDAWTIEFDYSEDIWADLAKSLAYISNR